MKMQDRKQPLVCALSVRRSDKKDEGTCSGILIDSKNGFLLTHSSVIASLLPSNSSTIQDMSKNFIWSQRNELDMLKVDIVFPSSLVEMTSKSWRTNSKIHPSFLNSIHTANLSMEKFTGSVYGVLKVRKLSSALEKLMPENSWEFSEDLKAPDFNKNSQKQKEENFFYKLLPCFLLIRINHWVPFDNLYAIKDSIHNFTGDDIEIVGTPFGCINPGVFLNSLSRGIISNTAGKDKVLILTDARCVPGTEGGAMYHRKGKARILTGIMIATLCWKNSEWVGLSMACGISHILEIIHGLQVNLQLPSLKENICGSWRFSADSVIQEAMKCVPMVMVGGTWGSGIVLWQDVDHQIILTCGHVVKDAAFRKVYVQYGDGVKRSATVLYRSVHNQQFDLAVIQCQRSNRDVKSAHFGKAREGDNVNVIGYGIFGEEHDLEPTVTSGNVSKVIHLNRTPVMIQTSCAVHAGASGGPVINQKGEVVGIAVCNAKDVGCGASYPHVNMCVPMETISPILQKFQDSKNSDVLNQLEIHSPFIQQLWSLNSTGLEPQVMSRL